VAWDGSEFVADWIDFRNYTWPQQDRTDVYAARIAPDNTVLDADGLRSRLDRSARRDPPPLAGTNGSALFSWATYRPEAPFGAFRIATRQLRSGATPFARMEGRTLVIDGTAQNDAISIGSSDGGTTATVSLNGNSMSFAESAFDAVTVNALAGDDTLTFTGGVSQPIALHGGTDRTTLAVNGGTFTLNGDASADYRGPWRWWPTTAARSRLTPASTSARSTSRLVGLPA
jgi:hypothetical protein